MLAPAARTSWLRRKLSWWQIVTVLALIFGSAYVMNQRYPSRRERAVRAELERADLESRLRAAHRREEIDGLLDDMLAQSGIPACQQLAAARTHASPCPTLHAGGELRAAIDAAVGQMGLSSAPGLEAKCAAAVAQAEAARTRLGCK